MNGLAAAVCAAGSGGPERCDSVGAQLVDGVGKAERVAEQGAACHQHVGTGCGCANHCDRADSAVDFHIDRPSEAGSFDHCAYLADLRLHGGDVPLAAETGIDGHHQHQVDQVEHVGDGRCRRGRVECHRSRDPHRGDVGQRSMQMGAGLGVHDQARAPCLHILGGHLIGRVDHQVRLERQRRVAAGGSNDRWTEGEVGDELTVHNVPLDAVDAGMFKLGNRITQAAEINRQNTRCDLDRPGDGSMLTGHRVQGTGTYPVPMASPPQRSTERSPETVRVAIERVVAGGDGLARHPDGRVVFVPAVLPGEVVDVTLVGAKRDFAHSRVVRLVEASRHRVTPPCPAHVRGCGGCDWQHVEPDHQLALKVEIVREAFSRTAHLPGADVIGGGSVGPWEYRTSMRFAVDSVGRPALRRSRSNEMVDLDHCLISHPLLDAMLADFRLVDVSPTRSAPRGRTGRSGPRGRNADSSGVVPEVSMRVSAATGQRTAWWSPATADATGLDPDVVTGDSAAVVEHVAGHSFRVSAPSFFQSGRAAAELLVSVVRELGGPELAAARTVVDAYGGVGLFAATCVAADAVVHVVEGSASACADARYNLADHDATVHESAVEQWTPTATAGATVDVVIADPSRQGLGAAAAGQLALVGAPVLILVSCDPVALARDAVLLGAAGYVHRRSVVADLFPHTHHVEAVTRFERVR